MVGLKKMQMQQKFLHLIKNFCCICIFFKPTILENIYWMIQYGRIEENADAAEIFEMEKFVEEAKLKMQNKILIEKNSGRKQGILEFVAYDGKKKKAEARLKGYAG